MKQLKLLCIFLILFSCSSRMELKTQQKELEKSEQDSPSNYFLFENADILTAEDYTTKLDSVKKGKSNDFFTLRIAYTNTKDYSPYGSDISDSLKKVLSLIDSLRFEDALSVLKYIHNTNFVNITSHLYCGYIYKQLGDSLKSAFHFNVYTGLLNSIYESGDGIAPETAYIVIAVDEEYAFLDWFDLKLNMQGLINQDGYSFDLLKVTNPKTKEELEIYFNVQLALNTLRKMFEK